MQKRQTILVVASLLVVVLSVTLAYFTAQIIGKGKDVSVSSADLKIIFTDTDGNIEGSNITPGWSNSKTFTVKNESNRTYKYDIIIKDLVNTFVTEGYLQYKITSTSTNNGYNMTDYVSVPKSSTATDTILAKNVSIAVNATQKYTIEFRYENDENVDQGDDMGKKLSGTLFITEGTKDPNQTLLTQLLEDNPTVSERKDFTSPFTTNTTNTLYKAKEDNTDVYYFAGVDRYLAHCEVEGIANDVDLLKFTNGYSTGVSIYDDTEAVDEDTCKTKSLCKIKTIFAERVLFDLTQAQCQELAKKQTGKYEGSEYSEDLTNRTWVTEQNKPINNWVKFGKYQKDLIRYRGYYSTTDTSYKEYSTMDECTSASSYNINCTEYKYANTGDDIYWRIIRTNSDGSIRLLYHGTSTTATDAYIGKYAFNTTDNDPMYVGYMYGTSGSQENNRTNTHNSIIKGVIDTWYKDNLNTNYGKYISTTAIYCNDRSNPAGGYNTGKSEFFYGAKTRLYTNKTPTYDCTNVNDKFTVDTSTGNGKLTYPIALMTADEVSFAGGVVFKDTKAWSWYNNNGVNGSSTGTAWWLLSPLEWDNNYAYVFNVGVRIDSSGMINGITTSTTGGVRPTISLKSCVKTSGGDGSASDPYTIQETSSGC